MRNQSTHQAFQLSYLRVLVTLLVVAHHSALAYVSFRPQRHAFATPPLLWTAFPVTDTGSWSGFDLLVGWNDVFFMALMFLVSGLFVWPALQRHGTATFISRRLLRLGVPFAVAAGLLAPLAYYPAYLQSGGDNHLASYARAWMALREWPAGPAWFLWVLLVFDCVAALCFIAIPYACAALARGVRAISNRPVLLLLLLSALSFAAYAPMAIHFGGQAWWHWGPFFIQSSRPIHYFVYFAVGVCLGAFGTEIPIFERTGRLAQRWWLWGVVAVVVFLALIALVLNTRFAAARILFPVSCAASSLFLMAVVIRFVRPSRWADDLSANAYGIYLLHYLFVIWIQYEALHWTTPAFMKGVGVFFAATGLSWLVAGLLRQSQIVARVV